MAADEYIRRADALHALYEDYAYPAMDIIKGVPAADVVENAVNGAPSIGPRQCANKILAA